MWQKLNFREWLALEAADPLANLRMLIDDPQQGLKAQAIRMQKRPEISQHFTNASLQNLFTSFNASITKIMDLAQRYRAYDTALERLKNAMAIFRELIGQLQRYVGDDNITRGEVKNMVQDMNDAHRELSKLVRMNKPINQPGQNVMQPASGRQVAFG